MPDQPFPAEMMPCIERFFREVDPTLPPGRDIYPEVFETELFFPLQRQAELRRMIDIARRFPFDGSKSGPKTVMEIGADKGAGVYHWCKCLPSVKRMLACEIRGTPYHHLFEKAFPKVKFDWSKDSKDAVLFLLGYLGAVGAKIDVLFIDGDKSTFLQDFDAYLPLMNPRGVVFMHDINEPGSAMRRAFETVKARGYRTEEIIDKSDWELSAVREAHGIPPANAHEAWLRYWRGRSCGVGVIYLEGKR